MMETVIQIENLCKSFGDNHVLNNISLSIPKGSVFGLLGPNGAGKTTTMRIMSCLIEPTSGEITILGKKISTNKDDIRRLIGCVTESPGIYDKLSVWDNLDFIAACHDIPEPKRSARIEELLRQFDLWEKRDAHASSLSKGMKQKVSIISALLHDPDVLFFDEVTANLDPVSIRKLKDMIRNWAANGKTIIFCSHVLSEIDELCNEFAIIRKHVISLTTPQQFREEWSVYNVELELASHHDQAERILAQMPEVLSHQRVDNRFQIKIDNPDTSNQLLLKQLVSADIPVTYIEKLSVSLEDSYLSLLQKVQEGK
ncbi:ABC transporter ATP-binding protein [Brevibacillus dissolubilis]|uniref:ABC transporter ATP-binding protein n=1 Tax=Brevibacillus dissolubilis TaxID=1844116 RepID=UPI0020FFF995|nr:ABC transporter ATP-binding protein [Brevibacillus dissolubilis]